MRLKLILSTSLFTTLAALVTSCSNNSSVVDDWPGIDEMVLVNEAGSQALTSGDSFTLKSKLNLPKMGKDVNFSIRTQCEIHRSKNQKRQYNKTSDYKSDQIKTVLAIPLIEILPEQVLIFPEFFERCDFSLTATNQIGSTQTEKLDSQKFNFNKDHLDFNLLNSKNAYNSKSISKLHIERKNLDKYLMSRLICLAGTRTTTSNISDEALEQVRGDILVLPETGEDPSVENCIVKAVDSEGKSLISNRIQIFNAELPPPPTVKINRAILAHGDKEQIFYRDSMKYSFKLINFSIYGSSKNIESFRMENGERNTLDIKIISDLETTSRNSDSLYINKTYKINTIASKSGYSWSDNSQYETFTVSENFETRREMKITPKFQCSYTANHNLKEAELGFILSINPGSSDFNIQKVIQNDFTTDVITTYNLFDLTDENFSLSNLPDGQNLIDDSTGISAIFRNNSLYQNTPLVLSSKVMQMQYGENGEPSKGFETIKQYPFMSRIYPNSISCSSEADFKTNPE